MGRVTLFKSCGWDELRCDLILIYLGFPHSLPHVFVEKKNNNLSSLNSTFIFTPKIFIKHLKINKNLKIKKNKKNKNKNKKSHYL